jgi:hypothetical protein
MSWMGAHAGSVPLVGVAAERKNKGKEVPAPCHFQSTAHRGACGKARVVPHNRRPGSGFMEWVIGGRVLLPEHDPLGGGRNEMEACQTRASAESVMPRALSAVAAQRSLPTLGVSR